MKGDLYVKLREGNNDQEQQRDDSLAAKKRLVFKTKESVNKISPSVIDSRQKQVVLFRFSLKFPFIITRELS